MNCRICEGELQLIFEATVLNKYQVKYFACRSCGALQSEPPYWLEEAYRHSLNLGDTGLVHRNQRAARITASIIILLLGRKKRFLDYAGGTGLFTRLMRDLGFDFYWTDPYTPNVLARGFEGGSPEVYSLVTTFESFEHFVNPKEEVEQLLKLSDTILLSTELLPEPIPNPSEWYYYGFDHGQHVMFYTHAAFQSLARQFGLTYYPIGNYHLLTRKKFSMTMSMLLSLPQLKYFLYAASFPLLLLMRSKTMSDQQLLTQKRPS
ncbi:MAG: class I SAM-dependent methyltransferase [Cyclobacteriaceae bacterium]|nr:class I SAM-dependent methyltransferase [Cyclobacteriaceae bacterium]